MRWARTRVFPEPAPARIRSGPSVVVTARACSGLSARTISSARAARRASTTAGSAVGTGADGVVAGSPARRAATPARRAMGPSRRGRRTPSRPPPRRPRWRRRAWGRRAVDDGWDSPVHCRSGRLPALDLVGRRRRHRDGRVPVRERQIDGQWRAGGRRDGDGDPRQMVRGFLLDLDRDVETGAFEVDRQARRGTAEERAQLVGGEARRDRVAWSPIRTRRPRPWSG